jgi:hypothetical protein
VTTNTKTLLSFFVVLQAFRESQSLLWPPKSNDMELSSDKFLPSDLVRFLSMVMSGKEDMETSEKMKRLVYSIGQDICSAVRRVGEEGEFDLDSFDESDVE